MIRLFVGYDPREADGWHTFIASLVRHGCGNVAITPLCGAQADGTNAFTYERFRIPEICNWSGPAIFVDGCDMLMRSPIVDLCRLYDSRFAVQVVKHEYRTQHARKYVGTEMESPNADYERKNWSSVILWNCGHMAHFEARAKLRGFDGMYLHRFQWLTDAQIGSLPMEWNWLVDEYGPNEEAKLLHWTAGMPGFAHYAGAPMAHEWHKTARTIHSSR